MSDVTERRIYFDGFKESQKQVDELRARPEWAEVWRKSLAVRVLAARVDYLEEANALHAMHVIDGICPDCGHQRDEDDQCANCIKGGAQTLVEKWERIASRCSRDPLQTRDGMVTGDCASELSDVIAPAPDDAGKGASELREEVQVGFRLVRFADGVSVFVDSQELVGGTLCLMTIRPRASGGEEVSDGD